MRNNEWLKEKLDQIWQDYFSNVSQKNDVEIKFGRCARTRLGSIKQVNGRRFMVYRQNKKNQSTLNNQPSTITLTGYFKDERVPEFMIDAVIGHELCHYAHGFSSPLPQLFKYPHQGKAVDRELIKRGLGDALIAQRKWLKTEWKNIIGPAKRRRRIVRRKRMSFLQFLLSNS